MPILSKRIKTNKLVEDVLQIARQEIQKHGAKCEVRGDFLHGKLYSGPLVINKYTLKIAPKEGGYLLEISAKRNPSVLAVCLLIFNFLGSCLLVPLIMFFVLLSKIGKITGDPNMSPFDKILEGIKEECEMQA